MENNNQTKAFIKRFFMAFLCLLVVVSLPSFTIVVTINSFSPVPFIMYFIVVGASIVLDIDLSLLINVGFNKGNSAAWFLYDHALNFLSGSSLLGFFLCSIRPEPVLTVERATDLLGIEWTIFAITVAVFAVWRTLVFDKIYSREKLDNSSVKDETLKDEKAMINHLEKKNRLRRLYIMNFEPVVYIAVNLLAVCISTLCCFTEEYGFVNELFVVFAAFVCINSLATLMTEIIMWLYMKRKDLIEETRVKPSHFSDLKETKAARDFLENLDEIDKGTIKLKDFKTGDKKTDACISRCNQLLQEYRNDKQSAFANRKELVILSQQLPDLLTKTTNNYQKKINKVKREMNKIDKIMGNND